ncbi:MAG: hypothetical protein WCX22_00625 [Methanoregula sp.]
MPGGCSKVAVLKDAEYPLGRLVRLLVAVLLPELLGKGKFPGFELAYLNGYKNTL